MFRSFLAKSNDARIVETEIQTQVSISARPTLGDSQIKYIHLLIPAIEELCLCEADGPALLELMRLVSALSHFCLKARATNALTNTGILLVEWIKGQDSTARLPPAGIIARGHLDVWLGAGVVANKLHLKRALALLAQISDSDKSFGLMQKCRMLQYAADWDRAAAAVEDLVQKCKVRVAPEEAEADSESTRGEKDKQDNAVEARLLAVSIYTAQKNFTKAGKLVHEMLADPSSRPAGFTVFDLMFILARISERRSASDEEEGDEFYKQAYAVYRDPAAFELPIFEEEKTTSTDEKRAGSSVLSYFIGRRNALSTVAVSGEVAAVLPRSNAPGEHEQQLGLGQPAEDEALPVITDPNASAIERKISGSLTMTRGEKKKMLRLAAAAKKAAIKKALAEGLPPPVFKKEKKKKQVVEEVKPEASIEEKEEEERRKIEAAQREREAEEAEVRGRLAWLADGMVWRGVADKCMAHWLTPLAADLYMAALLRSPAAFASGKMWFSFATACFQCGRHYDARMAVQQAHCLDRTNSRFARAFEHCEAQARIQPDEEPAAFGDLCVEGGWAASLRSILTHIPDADFLRSLQACRLQSYFRGIVRRNKERRAREEARRIALLRAAKPLVMPTIIWEPAVTAYPCVLSYEHHLNAVCIDAEGTFKYYPDVSPSRRPFDCGNHTLKLHFEPADKDTYFEVDMTATLVVRVNADIPVILWEEPEPILIGSPLTEKQFSLKVCIAGAPVPPDKLATMGKLKFTPALGTVLPLGTHRLRVKYTPHDELNYVGANARAMLEVQPLVPTVIWSNPASIMYPSKLSAIQLNATCPGTTGTFIYTPSALDNPLPVGIHQLTCTFWPYESSVYREVSQTVTIVVEKPTPVIHWPPPPCIYEGSTLDRTTHLNATVVYAKRTDVPDLTGRFIYSVKETEYLAAGHHEIRVDFIPDDLDNYFTTDKTVTLTVRCKPEIDWPQPPILRYGNPLTPEYLNAICTVCSGTFEYDPPLGFRFEQMGPQVLTATFTPADQSIYDVVQATVTVDVIPKLIPEIEWDPPSIQYLTPLSYDNVFNAKCKSNSLSGKWIYEERGEFRIGGTPSAGVYIANVTFSPDNAIDYQDGAAVAKVIVEKRAVKLSWPNRLEIDYGRRIQPEHLQAQLKGIPPHIAPSTTENSSFGSFEYSHEVGTLLRAGTHEITVTFRPTDEVNFTAVTKKMTLGVNRYQPEIIWSRPKPLTYGAVLTETELCATVAVNSGDDKSIIHGAFTYNPAIGYRLPSAGVHALSCVFTPDDAFNYSTVERTIEISVRRAVPKIIWDPPANIFEGTPLTPELQLNATCSFPPPDNPDGLTTADFGTLVYTPPAGKKLEVGQHTLQVRFKPHPGFESNFDLKEAVLEVPLLVVLAKKSKRGGTDLRK